MHLFYLEIFCDRKSQPCGWLDLAMSTHNRVMRGVTEGAYFFPSTHLPSM